MDIVYIETGFVFLILVAEVVSVVFQIKQYRKDNKDA